MNSEPDFKYAQANSLSDLFAPDLAGTQSAFLLNYPATASWAAYPNTKRYFIQDGSSESTKTSFDKICQKEPWKNLAVLGDEVPGIIISPVQPELLHYWQDHFGHSYTNLEKIDCSIYLDELSQSDRFDQIVTLFPFDHLKAEKHAVPPDTHYRLLSKVALNQLGVQCPYYDSYDLRQTRIEDIPLPQQFPYLIKTSHGLSGEGTYIIRNPSDLHYCQSELRKYLEIELLQTVVVSEFVKDVVENYCAQFYVNRAGEIGLIGTTRQLTTSGGDYLGGVIDYSQTDMSKFFEMVSAIGKHAHQQGYFGVIGFDVLETREGQLYAIDANFRVNGSTPLCLQRQTLLEAGKAVAKYSTDYRMSGTIESILSEFKPELDRKDLLILSAQEKVKYGNIYTDIYGIIAGETLEEMQQIERNLQHKGLHL
ncbi:MAG: carbamoylphosphate synthase large subunit [Cyanobacteria bacterium Co-bin8]|nr:carbamoylphosphate synthase large subunit [Cyanobacteria bacterium Co-bin8]